MFVTRRKNTTSSGSEMNGIFHNQVLLTAIAANFTAQLLKVIITFYPEGSFQPRRLFETGGMPSSHTAGIIALAAGLGITEGWDSAEFAIGFTLAAFIIYDAAKVRHATGKHAEVLNVLIRELEHLLERDSRPQALKTLLGHTLPQVVAGAFIGLLATVISFRPF
ncbi:MAG: divergent PAP2 family protein [Patescibacteria group bacterium]